MTSQASPVGAMRNIALLAATQATLGSQQALVMTVGALVGVLLAPNPAFATLPATAMIVGLALSAGPSAYLVHRIGRQRAFIGGGLLTICASLLAAIALLMSSFTLFCIATGLIGVSAALGQQYRFAAADTVPQAHKGRAISLVLLGGVMTGFIGPSLSIWARTWVAGAEYAGSFLGMTGLAIIAVGILSLTRLPKAEKKEVNANAQSVGQLIRSKDVFVPVLTGMASYGLMTLIMIATPLAMVVVCGHSKEAASTAIQWHIIAMFLPSFITGSIISRIGARTVTGIGLTLILACALVALNGRSIMHFDIALVLLGVGWNFGFIGSTTMLAAGYRPEDAARVQTINEQVVFGAMAIASIGSGLLLQLVGWDSVLVLTIPLATAAIALLAWREWTGQKVPAA